MSQANGSIRLVLKAPGDPDQDLGQAGDTTMASVRTRVFSFDDEEISMFIQRIQVELKSLDLVSSLYVRLYSHTSRIDEDGVLLGNWLLTDSLLKLPDRMPNVNYVSFEIYDAAVVVNWALHSFSLWGTTAGRIR